MVVREEPWSEHLAVPSCVSCVVRPLRRESCALLYRVFHTWGFILEQCMVCYTRAPVLCSVDIWMLVFGYILFHHFNLSVCLALISRLLMSSSFQPFSFASSRPLVLCFPLSILFSIFFLAKSSSILQSPLSLLIFLSPLLPLIFSCLSYSRSKFSRN